MVSTSTAAAAGLRKQWKKNDTCCPIALCIFEKGQPFAQRKRNNNQFDGFIQFTDTIQNKLYITGFLDIENATPEITADDQGFDVHVVNCGDLSFQNIEGGLALDNVDDIFDRPFVEVRPDKRVSDVVGKCCVVAKDVGATDHQVLGVAKVKQAVKCDPPTILIGSDPNQIKTSQQIVFSLLRLISC